MHGRLQDGFCRLREENKTRQLQLKRSSLFTFNFSGQVLDVLFNAFKKLWRDLAFALGSSCSHEAVDVVKPTHNIVTSAHEVSDVVKSGEGSQDYSENPLMSNLKTNEQCQSARK